MSQRLGCGGQGFWMLPSVGAGTAEGPEQPTLATEDCAALLSGPDTPRSAPVLLSIPTISAHLLLQPASPPLVQRRQERFPRNEGSSMGICCKSPVTPSGGTPSLALPTCLLCPPPHSTVLPDPQTSQDRE